jgi:hypothetical protein
LTVFGLPWERSVPESERRLPWRAWREQRHEEEFRCRSGPAIDANIRFSTKEAEESTLVFLGKRDSSLSAHVAIQCIPISTEAIAVRNCGRKTLPVTILGGGGYP